MAWIIPNQGPVGIGKHLEGPIDIVWGFGSFVLPLAALELYLRTKTSAGPRVRLAMAGGLVVLAAPTGVGIAGAFLFMWRPLI